MIIYTIDHLFFFAVSLMIAYYFFCYNYFGVDDTVFNYLNFIGLDY